VRKTLVLAVCLGLPGRAVAQSGAAVSADAVVVTVGMTIATLRDLNFGTVIKGVATTVLPTAGTAGEWQVTGSSNAFVIISFTLPAQLTNIQALPGSTMPITFSATSARWNRANNDAAAGTAFDPAIGAVGRFGPPPSPNMYVWLGGTVNPAAAAKPGIYQGTVVVSLIYQ
jgi:uncharacterized protein DUF4402